MRAFVFSIALNKPSLCRVVPGAGAVPRGTRGEGGGWAASAGSPLCALRKCGIPRHGSGAGYVRRGVGGSDGNGGARAALYRHIE